MITLHRAGELWRRPGVKKEPKPPKMERLKPARQAPTDSKETSRVSQEPTYSEKASLLRWLEASLVHTALGDSKEPSRARQEPTDSEKASLKRWLEASLVRPALGDSKEPSRARQEPTDSEKASLIRWLETSLGRPVPADSKEASRVRQTPADSEERSSLVRRVPAGFEQRLSLVRPVATDSKKRHSLVRQVPTDPKRASRVRQTPTDSKEPSRVHRVATGSGKYIKVRDRVFRDLTADELPTDKQTSGSAEPETALSDGVSEKVAKRMKEMLDAREVKLELAVDEDLLITMRNAFGELRKTDSSSTERRREARQSRPISTNLVATRNITTPARWKDELSRKRLDMFKRSVLATERDEIDSLQINQRKDEVLDMVDKNTYSIIVAATGTGKSSQLPQVFLNDAIKKGAGAQCKVACIQPRRIAASSIARRIASERGQGLCKSVGYQVRFDRRLPKMVGNITYFTTGIMLERLLYQEGCLDQFSHIVLDEVHERDIQLDFLMMLLRDCISRRKAEGLYTPKVIVTSATLDVDRFANYFQNQSPDGTLSRAPGLYIHGRTYEVKKHYLEDLLVDLPKNHSELLFTPLLDEESAAIHLKRHRIRSEQLLRKNLAEADQKKLWEAESSEDTPSPEIQSSESQFSLENQSPENSSSTEIGTSEHDHSSEIEPSEGQYSSEVESSGQGLSSDVDESLESQSSSQKRPFEPFARRDPLDKPYTGTVEDSMSGAPIGLICAAIFNILTTSSADGAILVFLPGMRDITLAEQWLRNHAPSFGLDMLDEDRFRILRLHSELPDEHMAAFQTAPPGCRRIILSTNIAETSVTITDIRYVVDCGQCRQKLYYPESRASKLAYSWISKSCVAQRAGRAGRVQDGEYWAVYPKETYDCLSVNKRSEMVRGDLQPLCLQVRNVTADVPIAKFLDQALEPPQRQRVAAAIDELQYLGAMDEKEQLTPLGEYLSTLPLPPALGKLIILGLRFRCLDPLLILAALGDDLNLLNLGLFGDDKNEQLRLVKEYAAHSSSDHLTSINIFKAVRRVFNDSGREAAHTFAYGQFISFRRVAETMQIAEGLLKHMQLYNVIDAANAEVSRRHYGSAAMNVNSGNTALIKALLLHVFSRNLAKASKDQGHYRIGSAKTGNINSFSINQDNPMPLFVFGDKGPGIPNPACDFVFRSTSQVTPLAACLLGGWFAAKGDQITLDSWLKVRVNADFSSKSDEYATRLLVELRKALDTVSLTSSLSAVPSHS